MSIFQVKTNGKKKKKKTNRVKTNLKSLKKQATQMKVIIFRRNQKLKFKLRFG